MNIIAIRHTAVDIIPGICYGRLDVPLSKTFETEAKTIKNKLNINKYAAIHSSPSIRCKSLAIKFQNEIPIYYDANLLELNFGEWEGKMWKEISKTKLAKIWFKDWVNTPCPQGESYHNLKDRVNTFISSIKKQYTNQSIILITHGGVIKCLHSICNSISPQEALKIPIAYGSITNFCISIHL